MHNTSRMEVLESAKDLAGEPLRDILAESAMFAHTVGDGTPRDVFEEPARGSLSSCSSGSKASGYAHTHESRCLLEPEVRHDVRMIEILEDLALPFQDLQGFELSGAFLIYIILRMLDLLHRHHLAG